MSVVLHNTTSVPRNKATTCGVSSSYFNKVHLIIIFIFINYRVKENISRELILLCKAKVGASSASWQSCHP
jgi:hypothetical protein